MKTKLFTFLFLISYGLYGQDIEQTFTIQINHDTIIETINGSFISIPANSFEVGKSNLETTEVELVIKEIINTNQMIIEDVSTQSANELLISNGMIYLQAEIEGNKISLAPESKIEIKLLSFDGRVNQNIYFSDSTYSPIWDKTDISLSIDTCKNRRKQIIYEYKKVKKEEYKQWVEENKKNSDEERLFGGKSIDINLGKKVYEIPIPIDTIPLINCYGNVQTYHPLS